MFHPDSRFVNGKVVATEDSFSKGASINPVWLKTDSVDEDRRQSIIKWLVDNESRCEIVWVAGERWGERPVTDEDGVTKIMPYHVINDGSTCWSLYDFEHHVVAEDFAAAFSDILVTPRDRDVSRFVTKPAPLLDGVGATRWFGESPYEIINGMIGLDVEHGKIRNLMSWSGERTLDIFYYLDWLCRGHTPAVVNEVVNFILGPMAAKMKERELGFEDRNRIIHAAGLKELGTALAAGLIPDGARKDLYAALLSRFNAELHDVLLVLRPSAEIDETYSARDAARVVFYAILCDVLEPIFSQAGGDEIKAMIKAVLDANPAQAAKVAEGDQKVIGWAMGQVMRASPTKLDPATVRAAIIEFQG
jgi:hypothetical protein